MLASYCGLPLGREEAGEEGSRFKIQRHPLLLSVSPLGCEGRGYASWESERDRDLPRKTYPGQQMYEHQTKSHREESRSESDLKRLISREGPPFGFSHRSGKPWGGGLWFGVSRADSCRTLGEHVYEDIHSYALSPTQRRLHGERQVKNFQEGGRMVNRIH